MREQKREREGGGMRVKRRSFNSALSCVSVVSRKFTFASISLTMATIFRRDSIVHMRAARIWAIGRSESSRVLAGAPGIWYVRTRCYTALCATNGFLIVSVFPTSTERRRQCSRRTGSCNISTLSVVTF